MNEADLNNTFKYDKVVVNLNNHDCLTTDATKTSFYVNLVGPIKNVVYIKILRASIVSPSNNPMKSAPLSYEKYEPIYITLNDYHRSVSYIKNNGTYDYVNYFDILFYNRVLTSTERQQVHNYLTNSYLNLFTGGSVAELDLKSNAYTYKLPNIFNLAGKS